MTVTLNWCLRAVLSLDGVMEGRMLVFHLNISYLLPLTLLMAFNLKTNEQATDSVD